MEEKRLESCNAEALLDEFFSQDNFRQLALSTGELIGCPLLVLDDTFHVAAHYLPLGFSDALFETAVRCGEITYEAQSSAKMRCSQLVGRTMSSWLIAPIGGVLHLSSARACASAA